MAAWSLWEEWAPSKLSQKVAEVMSGIDFMWMDRLGWSAPGLRGRLVAPDEAMAEKRTPRRSLEEEEEDVRGAVSETGRLGQARTPRVTVPFSMSARQTAYCSPRRKPFVPSMGSRAQMRPCGPPALLPLSMAWSIASSLGIGPPRSLSEVASSNLVVRTRSQIWRERGLFSRKGLASSSPTMSSLGKLLLMAWMISAWAPKSPMVTGDLSSLERVPLDFSWKTRWVRRVARWTASWAMYNSCSYDMGGDGELRGMKGERCLEKRARREEMIGILLRARITSIE